MFSVTPRFAKLLATIFMCMSLTACLGTVVGTAVDVAVEVVKIPVKVAGAVIGAAKKNDFADSQASAEEQFSDVERARILENEGIQ